MIHNPSLRNCSLLFLLLGCVASAAGGQDDNTAQTIGPDDSLTIAVLDADELSKVWRVASNGTLSLPLVGRVQAAGLTVEAFEQDLAERLSKYIREPQVTAFISERNSHPVVVTGAVATPGTLQLAAPTPLFEVLVKAGGPKDPGPTVTITREVANGTIPFPGAVRMEDGKYDVITLDLKTVMQGHGDSAEMLIQAHDVVSVAQDKVQRLVHIAGEVTRAGGVELVTQNTLSLMKLIAVAGGLSKTASTKNVMITHLNEAGVQTATAYVDVGRILKGKSKDIELIPGDMVFIPSSKFAAYMQTMTNSAMNTGMLILTRF